MNLNQKFCLTTACMITSIGLSATAAEAITYRLDWTGQFLGYQIEGTFSYDENEIPADGIISQENLESFDVEFLTPEGDLIKSFEDNHLAFPEFNFNFDTNTGEILQQGRWDEPDGITIGEARGEGLSFWSIDDLGPTAPFDFPDGLPSPHVHLTDFAGEFPDLPLGLGSNLDVAFFTRTRAEILGDPDAGDILGQQLMATAVPEPVTMFGSLFTLGFGVFLKQRKA